LIEALSRANYNLYQSTTLLNAWRLLLARQVGSGEHINRTFAPIIQASLIEVYGWLIIAACKIDYLPEHPPRSVNDLPDFPVNLVLSAELSYCESLEKEGWIADLLRPLPKYLVPRQAGNLAAESTMPSIKCMSDWGEKLRQLSKRLTENSDEC
jgi:hypothetical protein